MGAGYLLARMARGGDAAALDLLVAALRAADDEDVSDERAIEEKAREHWRCLSHRPHKAVNAPSLWRSNSWKPSWPEHFVYHGTICAAQFNGHAIGTNWPAGVLGHEALITAAIA
jgi:hypothetical protein